MLKHCSSEQIYLSNFEKVQISYHTFTFSTITTWKVYGDIIFQTANLVSYRLHKCICDISVYLYFIKYHCTVKLDSYNLWWTGERGTVWRPYTKWQNTCRHTLSVVLCVLYHCLWRLLAPPCILLGKKSTCISDISQPRSGHCASQCWSDLRSTCH